MADKFPHSKEALEQLERLLVDIVRQREVEWRMVSENREPARKRFVKAFHDLNKMVIHGKIPDDVEWYFAADPMSNHSQIGGLEGVSKLGPWKVSHYCYLDLALGENQWCVMFGEDLQNGVSGFGNTPTEAVEDFERQFRTEARLGGWSAWVNGREDWKTGSGATEEEAIQDLLRRIEAIAAAAGAL